MDLSDSNHERYYDLMSELEETRMYTTDWKAELEGVVERALRMNEHEMRPGIVDILTSDVVTALMETDKARIGWLILGDVEEVHRVYEVMNRDSYPENNVGYVELATLLEDRDG